VVWRSVALALCVLLPASAHAADDRGATAGVTVSASNMESRTDVAMSGTFGFRLNRVANLELEVTFVPRLKSDFPNSQAVIQSSPLASVGSPSIAIYPPPVFSNPGGRLVILSNNVRVDLPTTTDRVTPYFVAGGGVASLRRTADYTYRIYGVDPLIRPTPGVILPLLPSSPITQVVTSSSTNLALTLGGGVSVEIAGHVAVQADLRVIRLFGEADRNIGRFGVGLRYRF
jgi:opacity protein-like surface antigen